jgi:Flp pilus assembly CpaE family ATPase
MASIRAATAAMDTYEKLGYPKEKIKLVLSAIFPHSSLTKEQIESAMGMSTIVTIPYVQGLFVDAINLGQPPVFHKPHEMVSGLFEDFSLHLSKDKHKKNKPQNPTETWKQVYKRFQERKK